MDDQDIVQARLKEIMRMGQAGAEQLAELLHRQHYDFAHKLVPYIISEHFDDLISGLANNSAQQWICRIWKDSGDAALANYSAAVYPVCQFIKASDEIGVVYFVMPAPRTTGEALYTSIVFLMDEDLPSTWLSRYFTLELGSLLIPSPYLQVSMEDGDPSVRWTFAEWDHSEHINRGKFEFEPTLNNFLSAVVAEAQNDWC
jgi:hypothetical protein